MNNPKIFDHLWKHFSFIGNQGHRINVLPPKGIGCEYLPTSKTSHCMRTACMAFPLTKRYQEFTFFPKRRSTAEPSHNIQRIVAAPLLIELELTRVGRATQHKGRGGWHFCACFLHIIQDLASLGFACGIPDCFDNRLQQIPEQ